MKDRKRAEEEITIKVQEQLLKQKERQGFIGHIKIHNSNDESSIFSNITASFLNR